MAEKPWDWITDDDVADTLKVGATLLGIRDRHKSSEAQEAWARFNKQADAMQLAHYIDRQKEEAGFDRRMSELHEADRATLLFEVDTLRAEQDAIRQRLSLHDTYADREVQAAYRHKSLVLQGALAEIDTRAGTLAARRSLVDVRATSARDLYTARGRTLDATSRRLATEATEEEHVRRGRQDMVDAGWRALAAEEAELDLTAAIRARQRRRALGEEIGAAAVGAAARGVTGSIEGTAAAAARQRAGEDLAVLDAQTATQQALLERRGAELGLEASRITADRALGMAARAVRGAQLGEAGVRARTDLLLARGEADVARRQLTGEAVSLGLRRGATEAEMERTTVARDRALLENKLKRAASSLEGARSGLAQRRAQAGADRAGLAADRARAEARTADISATLAQWSLEHVPELPDYEGARLRSTIGGLLGLGASMIDND